MKHQFKYTLHIRTPILVGKFSKFTPPPHYFDARDVCGQKLVLTEKSEVSQSVTELLQVSQFATEILQMSQFATEFLQKLVCNRIFTEIGV